MASSVTDVDMTAEITRYLDKLGTTTAEIRTSLVDLRVVGRRGSRDVCPLARYLGEAIAGTSIRVHGSYVSWGSWVENHDESEDYGEVELSSFQAAFIRDFDNARYPELIDESLNQLVAYAAETAGTP